ncbi:hypothetical protein AN958_03095 [Leucoagaricus sp. SymC.cos]|nr:hypothetical protein AN958_03095 [Leucoagaricus sp. SymC.cos]
MRRGASATQLYDTQMVVTRTEYLAPADPSMPGLVLEVTELVDSYMIWIGVAASAEKAEEATVAGRLTRDWACAMPPKRVRRT